MLLLLVVPLGLLWFLVATWRHRLGFSRLSVRGAFVLAYLVFQVILLAITELTSIGHHFTAWTVAAAWLVVTVVLGVAAWRPAIRIWSPTGGPTRIGRRIIEQGKRLTGEEWIWIAVMVAILGILAGLGSIYRPAIADSLVYHLARVEHWIQNRSIAPFATHYLAQIELSPLGEYNLAHLHLLAGDDRFDWSVSWLSAVVSIVGVTELARLLGASRAAQMTTAVICATIPTGILLAANTENDYFAAGISTGLLVVAAAFTFGRGWSYRAVALGAAAGLAFMTKGTLPLMLAPAVIVLLGVAVYRSVRSQGGEQTFVKGVMVTLVGGISLLIVIVPFESSSVSAVGGVIGQTAKSTMSTPLTAAGFGGNVVRSFAANFDIGDGTSGVDTYLSRAVLPVSKEAYSIFGVSQNDLRFTLGPHVDTFAVGDYSFDQRVTDIGADPWDVLLILFTLVVLAVSVVRKSKKDRVALAVALALACGFVLFTGAARWTLYNVRYMVPLLVAWSALIAIALDRFPRWTARLVMIGLVFACLPELLNNTSQPLIPPTSFAGSYLAPYFMEGTNSNPSLKEATAYQQAADVLTQSTCKTAALANWLLFEYPLWVALDHGHWKGTLNDTDVDNHSRELESREEPCAWVRQEGPSYVTPRNGTINEQSANVAVSVDPADAASIRVQIPKFSSSVPGTRIFPGGGWALTFFGTDPLLARHGSLYVLSDSSRRAELELHEYPASTHPTLRVTVGGREVPTVAKGGVIRAALDLKPGANRVDLDVISNSPAGLGFTDIKLRPPTQVGP